MEKTGIFFGSTTGTTEHVAKMIAERAGVRPADIHDVAYTEPSTVGRLRHPCAWHEYMGSGEPQADWS